MNYTDLVGAVSTSGSLRDFVSKSSVPATVVLEEAEAWIYRRLRVRQMLSSTTGSMSTSNDYISTPSDYIAARVLRITGANAAEVRRKTLEDVEAEFAYDNSGTRVSAKPRVFYAAADRLQFECLPDQAYAYRLVYFAIPAALSASNSTNFLTSRAPRLIRAACLMMANEYLKDEDERAWWEVRALAEIETLNQESDFEMRGLEADVVAV